MRALRIVVAAAAWAIALACVPQPSADPACNAASPVTGKRGLLFVTDSGEQPRVFVAPAMNVNALLPRSGSGRGYVTCPGTDQGQGHLSIDAVPTSAPYLFQLDNLYVLTQRDNVDFTGRFVGRPDFITPTKSTQAAFNLTNMDAWSTSDDFLELYSSNARLLQTAPETTPAASGAPIAGETTLGLILDWKQLAAPNGLPDTTKRDVLLVNQYEAQTVATGTASALTKQARIMTTMRDGQPASLGGSFAALPMTNFSLTWSRGAFQSTLAAMATDAIAGEQDLFLVATPEGSSFGNFDFSLDLWLQAFPTPASDDLMISGSFGEPPTNTNPLAITVQSFPVTRAGETVNGFLHQEDTLTNVNGRTALPLCTAVLQPKLNDGDLLSNSSLVVGPTPTVSWTLPSPSPDAVRIIVAHANTGTAAKPAHTDVATLLVPTGNGMNTHLDLPAGVLASGEQYFLLIDAIVAVGWNVDTTPSQPTMPQCFARIVTQTFTATF